MNGRVNTLFLGSNKKLVAKEKMVLECEKELTNVEKDILKNIFNEIKQNGDQNKGIEFSKDDYSEETLINLQNKKAMILNLEKKEYVLTQWYQMICHKDSDEVTIHVEDIVFEYLQLFVLDEAK